MGLTPKAYRTKQLAEKDRNKAVNKDALTQKAEVKTDDLPSKKLLKKRMKAKIDEGEEGIEEAMAEIKAEEKRKRKAAEALGPDGKPKLTKRQKRVADHQARVSARGGETVEAAAKREVFVGGIPKDVNEDQLRTHFSGCGEITEVRVAMSGNVKKSRGYAFIAFKDKASCEAAIKTLDGQPFAGKPLKVGRPQGVDSTPSEDKPEPKGNPELEVMFYNLPYCRNKRGLKRKFRWLGATCRIRIPSKKEGKHINKHKGLAFVTYKTEEGFKAAMALNGTEWHGRVLKVEKRLDVPRPDKSKQESKDVQMGEGEKEEEDEDDEDEEEEEEEEEEDE